MAIIESIPGVKVTVSIGNEKGPTEEYDDPDETEHSVPTATKYIESQDDKEFRVLIEVDKQKISSFIPDTRVLVIDLLVDGQYTTPGISYPAKNRSDGVLDYITRKGLEHHEPVSGLTKLRKFKFTPVKTVEEASKKQLARHMEMAKSLGELEIQLCEGRETGKTVDSSRWRFDNNIKNTGLTLHEKALKGRSLSHNISYTPAETVRSRDYIDVIRAKKPLGRIVFKYLSKEALQKACIIPRPRSETPDSDTAPDLRNLSDECVRYLALERLTQIKKEKHKTGADRLVGMKRARGHDDEIDLTANRDHIRQKKIKAATIDLTDD